MRRPSRAGLALITLLAACSANRPPAEPAAPAPGAAAPAALDHLQAAMDAFTGTPQQRSPVVEAINASPALTQQLAAAANAGQLAAIGVAPPGRPPASPFATTIDRGKIVLASDFATQTGKKRLIDVAVPNEILPNNLVFVLGSLAYHLAHPPPTPQGYPNPAAYSQARLDQDARSFIQGWNDVVDAATRENANQPLGVQQQGALLANLRYRAVLLNTTGSNKLVFEPTGTIRPTEPNVAAVTDTVRRATLLDFGVP